MNRFAPTPCAQRRQRDGRGLACATILASLLAWAIGTGPVRAQPAATGVGSQFELVFWQSVAASEDVGQLEAYLSRYPDGTFAAIARAKIQRLRPSAPVSSASSVPPASSVSPASSVPPASSVSPASPAPVPGQVAVAMPAVSSVATAAPATATTPAAQPMTAASPAAAARPKPSTAPIAPPAPAAAVTAPAPVVTTAPVAPVIGPPPAAAPLAAAPPVSLADQLAALAQSQGLSSGQGAGPGAPGSDRTQTLPAAPDLPAPDPVLMPARFCSAVERNAFYDERFTPSKDAADENNRRAIAHLQALQALYDRLGQQGDPDGQNAVSTASKAYQATAAAAYQVSAGYDGLFRQMMAVPIVDCAPPPAKGKGQ